MMGRNFMKYFIILISALTAVAFLGFSVISTWQLFTILIAGESIRSELWVLLIMTFTAGVIMLSLAWGIVEIGEMRRINREAQHSNTDEE